jgi:hypothetical protein
MKNQQEFKTLRAYNINWLKNASENGGAQNMVINSMPKGNIGIVAQHVKYGRIYADATPTEFLKLIKNDINICELISDRHFPYKIYFDIEGDNKPANFKDTVINKINELFKDADIAISGSEAEIRKSYHIVLNNYHINNKEERIKLKAVVNYLKYKFNDGFDDAVYGNGKLMKTIYQSKPKDKGQRKQEIIFNDDERKHIITSFFNDTLKSINDIQFDEETTTHFKNIELKKPLDMGKEPKLKIKLDIPTLINIENLEALELLKLSPLTKKHTHHYTFFNMLFCFNNNVSFNSFLEWYKQKNNSPEKARDKANQWLKMGQFTPITIKAFRNMLSFYYPEFKTIYGTIKFNNLINTRAYTNIKTIDKITPNNFIESSNYKFTTFFMGMGCGKTEQMLMFLKTQPTKKFLFIIPNISLGIGIYRRIKQFDIQIEHYDEDYKAKNKKFKNKHEMKHADNLICCINSLHYLKDNKFDYVIIDEIETVNNKWFDNDTLSTTCETLERSIDAWNIYIRLLKDAERVFLLDAFITNTTLKFIESIEPNNYIIFKKEVEASDRKIVIIPKTKQWIAGIIEQLKQNKKVFIYYPFKTGNKENNSMEQLKLILESGTSKIGTCYNAETDDKILKELNNVNTHWAKYDFIITNSKITVGINYDDVINLFDTVFISIACFSSCRDVIQASCRPRHLKSNNIFVNFIDNRNSNINFTGDASLFSKEENPQYFNMVENIITEKTAPLKSTFYSFCKMAGYKISTIEINNELDAYIDSLVEDIDISYNTIEPISTRTANIILDKMADHTATSFEKVELKKYFFNKLFIDEQHELISEAWNGKYNKFFIQLCKLEPNIFKQDIFYKIQEYNKWKTLMPSSKELNNVKLSDALIDSIFDIEEWKFTRLSKKSGHKTILKNMYNTFFGRNIIESKKDDDKHSILFISDENIEMYEFGISNLRAFNMKITEHGENKITKYISLKKWDEIASKSSLDEFIDE